MDEVGYGSVQTHCDDRFVNIFRDAFADHMHAENFAVLFIGYDFTNPSVASAIRALPTAMNRNFPVLTL
jgi:hypothetical protein